MVSAVPHRNREFENGKAVTESGLKISSADDHGLTAVDAVAEALRKRILGGEFKPGEFLRDVKMAEQHETSRHTFRAAARTLVAQGLLRQEPFRGFSIPEFGPDDIVDITRMRSLLEGEAVRVIVELGIIPQAAEDAVEVMRHARRLKDVSILVTADRDFHRAIVQASQSVRLQRSYHVLESEIELLLTQRQGFYSEPRQMYDEHRELIDSLKSRRAGVAKEAFRLHWIDLQNKILESGQV